MKSFLGVRNTTCVILGATLVFGAASVGCTSAHAENITFPSDAGAINVSSYAGLDLADNANDDTAAIQKAISDNIDQNKILYFPNGTYNISQTLIWKQNGSGGPGTGDFKAFLSFQGQSRSGVIFKLKDNAPGFTASGAYKPVIETGYLVINGVAYNNTAFANNLRNFTVDIGTGNAGAVGIRYRVSNQGTLSDVTVKTSDPNGGQFGIDLTQPEPGPGMLRNVSVQGFRVGIAVARAQYGITFENITVSGQRDYGISNSANSVTIRNLQSTNTCPAVSSTDGLGLVVLLDSALSGGASGNHAIDYRGHLVARNITTGGYGQAIHQIDSNANVAAGLVSEFVSSAALELFPSAKRTLNLPVENTPIYNNEDLSKWQKVATGSDDITQPLRDAITAANAAGKDTVYVPHTGNRDHFRISDTVVVTGGVRRITFMGQIIRATGTLTSDNLDRAVFKVQSTGGDITFDSLSTNKTGGSGRFTWFDQDTTTPLVLRAWITERDSGSAYRNSTTGGKLFIDDVTACGWKLNGQRAWARQMNCENTDLVAINDNGVPTYMVNNGGTLWILGYKSEGVPTQIASHGGSTELLGGHIYTAGMPSTTRPAFLLDGDTKASLSYVSTVYPPATSDYTVQVRETRSGVTQELGSAGSSASVKAYGRGAGSAVPLFCAIPSGVAGVSGTNLWLKADLGVTKDGSNNVSQWDDQSGSNNHATQATGTAKPLFVTSAINSQPALRFDGNADFLSLPSGFSNFLSGVSAFVVGKPTSVPSSNNSRFFEIGNSEVSNSFVMARNLTTDSYTSRTGTTTQSVTTPSAPAFGTPYLLDVVHQGGAAGALTGATLSRNGQSVQSGTTYVPQNVTRSYNRIGRSGFAASPFFFAGDIAEVVLYNRALAASERQTIENSLIAKYGLNIGMGTGLKGQYYNGIAFNTLILTQTDGTVDKNWGAGSPGTSINADSFSVRWTGKVTPRFAGPTTFKVSKDGGCRLWVNNVLLIDQWTDTTTSYTGTLELEGGKPYDIQLEYFEGTGNASVKLEWSHSFQPQEVVPQSQFTPAP